MGRVNLKTVQELMGDKTIAMIVEHAHLAPTHELQTMESMVRPR
jgi:hypothetical protein